MTTTGTSAREAPVKTGRRLAPIVLALGALGTLGAFGGVGVWAWGAWRTNPATTVPTLVVTRQPFVRVARASGILRASKATPITVPPGERQKIAFLADEGTKVNEGDVVVRFDATAAKQELRSGNADLAAADTRLSAEQVGIGISSHRRESAAQLANEQLARRRSFSKKDPAIYARNQVIEAEIDESLSLAQRDHALGAKNLEGKIGSAKVALIGVERAKAALTVRRANEALARTEVRAPHAGVVIHARNPWDGSSPRAGDSLWAGETVAELPLLEEMEAELFVLEVDADGVVEGQAIELTVEAAPDRVFKGKIRQVEKVAKPRLRESPVQYFAVRAVVDALDPAVAKPGQRVEATITIANEDALVIPRQAVIPDGETSLVFRKSPTGFDPVSVELGSVTAGRVVVSKGLAPGDRIALRDPRVKASAAGSGSPPGGVGPAAAPTPQAGTP